LKFTPEGGIITVSIKAKDTGAHVIVEDTGIGIPADKLPDIFEPFYQVDSDSNRKYGGTGIGLTLVKQILDAHHSTISASSELGKYCRFDVILKDLK